MSKEYSIQTLTPGNIDTHKWYRFRSDMARDQYVRMGFSVNHALANIVSIGSRFRILCTNSFGVTEIVTDLGQKLASESTIICHREYSQFVTDIEIEVEEDECKPTNADYLRATVFYLTDGNEPVAHMTLADIWTYYQRGYKVEEK
ncbi:hypothetical protein AHP1_2011 [Aeromonas phage Ahp1_CNU-2021]|nr:hypothetical protein AHP1_2011 [Aeromonas phage Ahp1_CNU-2021]